MGPVAYNCRFWQMWRVCCCSPACAIRPSPAAHICLPLAKVGLSLWVRLGWSQPRDDCACRPPKATRQRRSPFVAGVATEAAPRLIFRFLDKAEFPSNGSIIGFSDSFSAYAERRLPSGLTAVSATTGSGSITLALRVYVSQDRYIPAAWMEITVSHSILSLAAILAMV